MPQLQQALVDDDLLTALSPSGITPDAIRERAYDLWERHHRPGGFELQLWFMAERELKSETKNGEFPES